MTTRVIVTNRPEGCRFSVVGRDRDAVRISLLSTVAVALAVAVMVNPAHAHDFHSSLTEITWRDGRLEASLRLFPDDIERALTLALGERFVLDGRPQTQERLLAYIQRHLEFGTAAEGDGEVAWRWVGEEIGSKILWVHLEAELPAGLEGAWCSNTLLFEVFDDQANLVNVRGPDGRRALSFLAGTGPLPIPPPTPAATSP